MRRFVSVFPFHHTKYIITPTYLLQLKILEHPTPPHNEYDNTKCCSFIFIFFSHYSLLCGEENVKMSKSNFYFFSAHTLTKKNSKIFIRKKIILFATLNSSDLMFIDWMNRKKKFFRLCKWWCVNDTKYYEWLEYGIRLCSRCFYFSRWENVEESLMFVVFFAHGRWKCFSFSL